MDCVLPSTGHIEQLFRTARASYNCPYYYPNILEKGLAHRWESRGHLEQFKATGHKEK